MRFFYPIPDRQCRRGTEGGKPKFNRESYSSGQALQYLDIFCERDLYRSLRLPPRGCACAYD